MLEPVDSDLSGVSNVVANAKQNEYQEIEVFVPEEQAEPPTVSQ